jgi:HSP20 family protein
MTRIPHFSSPFSVRNLVGESPFGDPFETLWSRSALSGGTVAQPMPLDLYATDDEVYLVAAVPGMQPDDLQLTVQRNTVTLSGKVGDILETDEGKKATWYIQELASGTYQRSVTLPFPVDADRAEAEFTHGILRVVLPKAEAVKPKQITIQTSQGQAIEASSTEKS